MSGRCLEGSFFCVRAVRAAVISRNSSWPHVCLDSTFSQLFLSATLTSPVECSRIRGNYRVTNRLRQRAKKSRNSMPRSRATIFLAIFRAKRSLSKRRLLIVPFPNDSRTFATPIPVQSVIDTLFILLPRVGVAVTKIKFRGSNC